MLNTSRLLFVCALLTVWSACAFCTDFRKAETVYDFIDNFTSGTHRFRVDTRIDQVVSHGITRRAIFQHPGGGSRDLSTLEFKLTLPDLSPGEGLFFMTYLAMSEQVLKMGNVRRHDGCLFAVHIDTKCVMRCYYPHDARWIPVALDLGPYAGKSISFELKTAPNRETEADWASWAEPKIVKLSAPMEGMRLPGPMIRLPDTATSGTKIQANTGTLLCRSNVDPVSGVVVPAPVESVEADVEVEEQKPVQFFFYSYQDYNSERLRALNIPDKWRADAVVYALIPGM